MHGVNKREPHMSPQHRPKNAKALPDTEAERSRCRAFYGNEALEIAIRLYRREDVRFYRRDGTVYRQEWVQSSSDPDPYADEEHLTTAHFLHTEIEDSSEIPEKLIEDCDE